MDKGIVVTGHNLKLQTKRGFKIFFLCFISCYIIWKYVSPIIYEMRSLHFLYMDSGMLSRHWVGTIVQQIDSNMICMNCSHKHFSSGYRSYIWNIKIEYLLTNKTIKTSVGCFVIRKAIELSNVVLLLWADSSVAWHNLSSHYSGGV